MHFKLPKMERNAVIENGLTELRICARNGVLKKDFDDILDRLGEFKQSNLVKMIPEHNQRSLEKAVKSGHVADFLEFIRDLGVTTELGETHFTVAHLAAHLGNLKILKALMSNPNLDINVQDKSGNTPLMIGINSAKSDSEAAVISGILMSYERCDVSKENNSAIFPLCLAIRKNYGETVNLLMSCRCLGFYSIKKLLFVCKLVMLFDQRSVLEKLFERLDEKIWQQLMQELSQQERLEPLKRFIYEWQKLNKVLQLGKEITVTDSVGHILHEGNIVRLLDSDDTTCSQTERQLLKRFANKEACILNKSGAKIVIKLLQEKVLAKITAHNTVYISDSLKEKILDGTYVGIGSYVKVISDVNIVKNLLNASGNFHQNIFKTCGKTGRILKAENETFLVGFAWGENYSFPSLLLLPGSAAEVENLDSEGNFISLGCVARVTRSEVAFDTVQTRSHLPTNAGHKALLGKLVAIQRIILIPFYKEWAVVIQHNDKSYGISANGLIRTNAIKDNSGTPIKEGDQVKIITEKEELKSLQTKEFGGWCETLMNAFGDTGEIIRFRVNSQCEPSDVVVQVAFAVGTFYLNPQTLSVQIPTKPCSQDIGLDHECQAGKLDKTKTPDNLPTVQIIERKDLSCEKKLGEGAFGTVASGYWNGTKCAIKQIKSVVTSRASEAEIMKEAKFHYSLKHPNIVQLYGISYSQDLWMIMQLIEGPNLYEAIFPRAKRQIKALEFIEKTRIALQISNGISYIHGRGFLHGDIKPHNMILDSSLNVFICDFGITRFLGNQNFEDFATKHTTSFGGTMYYIAPECLIRDESCQKFLRPTFKADIWSIGAVFFELFAEKELFRDEREIMKFKYFNSNSTVKEKIKKLEAPIRVKVENCLETKTESRPTAAELNDFFVEVLKLK